MTSQYTIEDTEAISRALAQDRADMAPGDVATLLFDVDGRTPGEPLRVQVLEVDGPGRYFGRLVEETNDLFFGMPVQFDEHQVAWIEPPNHPALSGISGLWDWARPNKPAPHSTPPARIPEPEPASPLPPYSSELVSPASGRQEVYYLPYHPPAGLVPAPEQPLSEFRREESVPARVPNPFEIWNPKAQPQLPVSPEQKEKKAGAFATWIPKPPQEPVQAPPPADAGIFSQWNPAAMAAEAAAMKEMDLWEIMVPKAEQGSMYQPEGEDPFEIHRPEPPPATQARASAKAPAPASKPPVQKAQKRVIKKAEDWTPPSVEWMAAQLAEALDLPKVWKVVREDRKSPEFLESQSDVDNGYGQLPIPLQTTVNYEMDGGNGTEELFNFLDLDTKPLRWLLDQVAEEDEEANEELNEIGYALQAVLSEAFDTLKPADLPGHFGVFSHGDFGNQEFIGYVENPDDSVPPEERKRRRAQEERDEEEAEAERLKRLKKLVGSWRPMPWEQAAEFLDIHYGLQNLAERLRKTKRTRQWKTGMKEYGSGVDVIEDFGEDDGDLERRVADFVGVPPAVLDRFGEDDLPEFWEGVLYPAFESIEEAWRNIRPDDLPGDLKATSDEGDAFVLYYAEDDGYNDPEEPEED